MLIVSAAESVARGGEGVLFWLVVTRVAATGRPSKIAHSLQYRIKSDVPGGRCPWLGFDKGDTSCLY